MKITSKISLYIGALLDMLSLRLTYASTISSFKLKMNATTSSHSCWGTCKAFIVAPACSRNTENRGQTVILLTYRERYLMRDANNSLTPKKAIKNILNTGYAVI